MIGAFKTSPSDVAPEGLGVGFGEATGEAVLGAATERAASGGGALGGSVPAKCFHSSAYRG